MDIDNREARYAFFGGGEEEKGEHVDEGEAGIRFEARRAVFGIYEGIKGRKLSLTS